MPPRTTRNSQRLRPIMPYDESSGRASSRRKAQQTCSPSAATSSKTGRTGEIKWLKCRDPDGIPVIVTYSQTGQGIYMVWDWSGVEDKDDEPEEQDGSTSDVDRMTPAPSVIHAVPQTPQQQHPFDAGSVLRTPIKRSRALRLMPASMDEDGMFYVHNAPGVYRRSNGDYRIILDHAVGSSMNRTREQVEQGQLDDDMRIFEEQVLKWMAERDLTREVDVGSCSDSGYEDMEVDEPSQKRRVRTAGIDGTIITRSPPNHRPNHRAYGNERNPQPPFATGPNGEKLDRRGRKMLGPEGTILVDPNFSFLPVKHHRLSSTPCEDEEGTMAQGLRANPTSRRLVAEATQLFH